MPRYGSVISVTARAVGTSLALPALTGDSEITVDDLGKLNWPSGAVRIGTTNYLYSMETAPDQMVDVIDQDEDPDDSDEQGTLAIAPTLKADFDVDEPVQQWKDVVAMERIATVQMDERGETLELRVPRPLWDRLRADIRSNSSGFETVELENRSGTWVITDVIAEEPAVDGSFINIATLPAKTDTNLANTGTDDVGFFTEAWSNPSRVTADDGSYATVVGSSPATPDVPGNTGYKYPATASDDPSVGAQNWDFPGAATGAPDDNGASAEAPSGLNTHYLKLTGFGFNVPAGATITGVQAVVIRRNNNFWGDAAQDNLVKLVKAGSVVGSDRSNVVHWPDAFTGIAYGGTSDLWGTTLTPGEVNDTDFGIAISADLNAGAQPRVDAVRLKVSYTTPAPTPRSFSHFLEASNFNFVIPDDAIITGITVNVQRKASADSGASFVRDNQVRIQNGGNTSEDRGQPGGTHWSTVDQVAIYGGDLWGSEWEVADLTDPAFAVLISADLAAGVTASIDYVKATVAYVMAGDA